MKVMKHLYVDFKNTNEFLKKIQDMTLCATTVRDKLVQIDTRISVSKVMM